jgi:hypothetical protein
LPDSALAPVVATQQTMRGMALVYGATLIAEQGGFPRFRVKRGSITKARNGAVVYRDRFIVRFPQVPDLPSRGRVFGGRSARAPRQPGCRPLDLYTAAALGSAMKSISAFAAIGCSDTNGAPAT